MKYPDSDTVMAVRVYEAALTLLVLPDITTSPAISAVTAKLRQHPGTAREREIHERLAALIEDIHAG